LQRVDDMKAAALSLLVIGAVIAYGARWILQWLGKPCGEKEVVMVKSVGLVLALVAAVCIFVL